jgi:prepilin-type N-terminal cleavage/methylation domain-containing protein/prepilin-type processing-associated H-X9-DG protein
MPLAAPSPGSGRPRRRPAFTLIELLTVIAVIGILAAILIPVVGRVRQSARTAHCTKNLHGLGTAFQLYAADNKGLYPAVTYHPTQSVNANLSKENWQVELGPYHGRTVKDLRDLGTTSDSYVFCPEFVTLYRDDPGWSTAINTEKTAGYGMNVKLGNGINPRRDRFKAALLRNPSRTILVGDSSGRTIDVGTDWQKNATKLGGYVNSDPVRHAGKAAYLHADGHVALFAPDVALAALNAP